MPASQFHLAIKELLEHLGLTTDTILAEEETLGLIVNDSYSIHFDLIDNQSWLIIADLGYCNCDDPAFYRLCLSHNQINSNNWQAIVAMTRDQHLICRLVLPLPAPDLPNLLSALDALLLLADKLLAASVGIALQLPETGLEKISLS